MTNKPAMKKILKGKPHTEEEESHKNKSLGKNILHMKNRRTYEN
jgi:hypothetical protein